ncbi:recombinase family protein [Streptomyces avermitilis]|uniref:recombinase family protein n=1 Tax=Streptomyces avermitilis TaxID=33903 RepID=UPI0033BDFB96
MKGTISEAELHLIKQRMWSGRLAKARRGELVVPLPIGFVWRPSGEAVLDPDEQVRSVVRLVFELFERFGTVNAVLCYLVDNHIQIGVRLREGPERGELAWRRPNRVALQNMLRHPAYAGIYVYGRSRLEPRRRQAGRPCTGRVRTGREDWFVYLPGLLPAYISVEQHERNLQRMDANRARSESIGVVCDGPALLAGLVVCGRCGTRMTVRYQRGAGGKLHPAYVCARALDDRQALSGTSLKTSSWSCSGRGRVAHRAACPRTRLTLLVQARARQPDDAAVTLRGVFIRMFDCLSLPRPHRTDALRRVQCRPSSFVVRARRLLAYQPSTVFGCALRPVQRQHALRQRHRASTQALAWFSMTDQGLCRPGTAQRWSPPTSRQLLDRGIKLTVSPSTAAWLPGQGFRMCVHATSRAPSSEGRPDTRTSGAAWQGCASHSACRRVMPGTRHCHAN